MPLIDIRIDKGGASALRARTREAATRRGPRAWILAAMAVMPLIALAHAQGQGYALLGRDWSFQKDPIEGRFVFCKTGAPAGASETIRDAAAKWSYAKMKFRFGPDNCPNAPPPNYIDFGALDDPGKTGGNVHPQRTGHE